MVYGNQYIYFNIVDCKSFCITRIEHPVQWRFDCAVIARLARHGNFLVACKR